MRRNFNCNLECVEFGEKDLIGALYNIQSLSLDLITDLHKKKTLVDSDFDDMACLVSFAFSVARHLNVVGED